MALRVVIGPKQYIVLVHISSTDAHDYQMRRGTLIRFIYFEKNQCGLLGEVQSVTMNHNNRHQRDITRIFEIFRALIFQSRRLGPSPWEPEKDTKQRKNKIQFMHSHAKFENE